MCWRRVGEANPLFSVCIALWRPIALAIIYNVVGRQRNLGLDGTVMTQMMSIIDGLYSHIKKRLNQKRNCTELIGLLREVYYRWLICPILCQHHYLKKKKYSWNVVDTRQRYGTHTYTITHRKKTVTVMLIKF